MLSFVTWRRESTSSNMVRETNTAVNTLDSRPMVSVVAKPRIGTRPELEQERRRDERRHVGVQNRQEHTVEARRDGLLHAFGRSAVLL